MENLIPPLGYRSRYPAQRTLMRYLLLVLIVVAGCSKPTIENSSAAGAQNRNAGEAGNVYEAVVAHLAQQDLNLGRFVGSDVWISPEFAKGNSLFYSWGNEIEIDDEMVDSLKLASDTLDPFPNEKLFGSSGRVTEIKSFHDLHYYGENMQDVDAKCLVEFWRPGFSKDGKRCVVRFYFGPTPHGAAGTYLLMFDGTEWKIIDSTISYYV